MDEARAALGGRVSGERTAARVEVDRGRGRRAAGVVVHSTPTEVDVWIGDGVFARVRAPEQPWALTRPSPELDAIVSDLERFRALRVGQRVAARRGRETWVGAILELCRYGALLDVDGKVVAVGFRSLEPR